MPQEKIVPTENIRFHLYYSKVPDDNVELHKLDIDSTQMGLIDLLMSVSATAGEDYSFDALTPRKNTKKDIQHIMSAFPNENNEIVKRVFDDFKEELKSQQRMENKYVMIILFPGNLEIIHSRKEPGIGQTIVPGAPPLQVIKRFFDSGNVDRWVRIYFNSDGKCMVKIYERHKSDILHRFLHVPKSARYYEFGDIRIILKLMDNEMTIELSIEEAIKKILDSTEIDFHGSQVKIGETSFQLVKLISNGTIIDTPIKLKQLLLTEKYNLLNVVEGYKKLPSNVEYYGHLFLEDKSRIYKITTGSGVEEQDLFIKPDHEVEIICMNDSIWTAQEYLQNIVEKLFHGKKIKFFHPAYPIAENPYDINNLIFLNSYGLADTEKTIITELLRQAYSYSTDNVLRHILIGHALKILSHTINGPMSSFFNALSRGICGHFYLNKTDMVAKNEDSFFEYKSGSRLSGNPQDDIEIIKKDILIKTSNQPSRCIIYGVDEKTKTIDGINPSIIKSDYAGFIEKNLNVKDMIIKVTGLSLTETENVFLISLTNNGFVDTVNFGILEVA